MAVGKPNTEKITIEALRHHEKSQYSANIENRTYEVRLSANKSLLRGLSLRFYGLYVTELSTDRKSQTRKIVVPLRPRSRCLCGILSCASPVKLQPKLHSWGRFERW